MKILHVYHQDSPLHAHYVSMLTAEIATADDVECNILSDPKGTADLCRRWHPDIVHMHGTADCPVLPSCRLVVSPHGMQPARTHYYAVIAQSDMEHDRLSARYPRIETVRNPIFTRTITPRQCADQILKVYRKVMDSDVLELMDDDTLLMLRKLLKVCIAGDKRWNDQELPALSGTAWRQLFIYAYQEGVDDLVLYGAELLGLGVPPVRPSAINNYVPQGFERPQPLGCSAVLPLLEHMASEIAVHTLSLCRIAELQRLLMFGPVDDERLCDELNAHKLTALAGRLMQIAAEQTLLDEGFMPLPPINDHQTDKLRKLIYNHLKI